LMISEAGGYSADWSGHPYDAKMPNKGLMSTADRLTWERLNSLLQPVFMSPEAP
jgi:fructose-1,6-bisphosphatase/inositol monophosphatase family enzyme